MIRGCVSHLAVPRSWECKRRREPCWVWPVGSWSTAEDSRSTPPVSGKQRQTLLAMMETKNRIKKQKKQESKKNRRNKNV